MIVWRITARSGPQRVPYGQPVKALPAEVMPGPPASHREVVGLLLKDATD